MNEYFSISSDLSDGEDDTFVIKPSEEKLGFQTLLDELINSSISNKETSLDGDEMSLKCQSK